MPVTPAQMRAKNKYDAKTYSEIKIKPRNEEAEKIRAHAEVRGESLTRFLVRAADTQMLLDAQTDVATLEMIEAAALEAELLEELDEQLRRGNSDLDEKE